MTRAALLVAATLLVPVLLHLSSADTAATSFDADVTVPYGVPDELVTTAVGTSSVDQIDVPFTVPMDAVNLVATLSWPNDGVTDLDLYLDGPHGESIGTQAATSNDPETGTVPVASAGAWTAHVNPFVSTGTTAHLHVEWTPATGGGPLATTILGQPFAGSAETFSLTAAPSGGTPPYADAWDLDGAGTFALDGASVQLGPLSPGEHNVTLRTTDAAGGVALATQELTVWSAAHDLSAICGGHDDWAYWTMEFNQTHGTCWMHEGHHTYFFGDAPYALRSIQGFAFSVEQQFAPSLDMRLTVETSMDGLHWTTVGYGQYKYLPDPNDPSTLPFPERQVVSLDIQGAGQVFRYLRIHEPPSLSQGLSGYLDHSQIHIAVDDASAPTKAHGGLHVTTRHTVQLSCEDDMMERFFDTHPCTFGGLDRYDSASFFQTYPLTANATLDGIGGSFTLAPFRADDFFDGTPLTTSEDTAAYVLTSTDGRAWTLQATIPAVYGVPTSFHVALDDANARFVRLFPQYHALFDDTVNNASLHHPRAFFLHSNVTLEGAVPVAHGSAG
jgi:hypothetical protein